MIETMADDSRQDATMLAAIMFTDIAGYSRMMEEDEDRTIRVLKSHNEIVLPLVEAADGEVIDAIGDGLLVLFTSVRNAITCAGTIHDAIDAHNRTAPASETFQLRIGVHLGEVRRDGERVYGNGVNMAARVQPFAEPGGICMTEDVYRQIQNKAPGVVDSIGKRPLKNISRKVELYRLVTGYEQPTEAPTELMPNAPPRSDFDSIKERILQEKEKLAARHSDKPEGSLENRIENKVFSVVERVMDKAIDKWESLPDERKEKAIKTIKAEIVAEVGSKHKPEKKEGEALQAVVFGTAASIGFGYGYFIAGVGWLIWPLILLGALPLLSGIGKVIKNAARRRRLLRTRPGELERAAISAAAAHGGTLSVAQLASEADLSLDEAGEVLDRAAAKGYVTQHITETGLVEYRFPLRS
jgi:class 3 adenylate cyclase